MTSPGPRRRHQWSRILGRLQRTASMRHPVEPSTPDHPAHDDAAAEPTDPAVYHAARHVSTPRPASPARNELTPAEILQDLLENIEIPAPILEARDIMETVRARLPSPLPGSRDVVGSVRARLPTPPPRYVDELPRPPPSPCSETATTYIDMASTQRRSGSSVNQPTTSSTIQSLPSTSGDYDATEPPSRRIHRLREHHPIPQGSPPLRPPRQVLLPPYYREYVDPFVYPAYTFICHYMWYVQISNDISICSRCATDEHTFCSFNRQRAVWRHFHAISRTFQNTSVHCGRCYGLLMNTRRAIDCLTCRLHVIDMQGRTEHLVYTLLCDTTVGRG